LNPRPETALAALARRFAAIALPSINRVIVFLQSGSVPELADSL
jgi:hypothetical protein